jgi:hypothetical protein
MLLCVIKPVLKYTRRYPLIENSICFGLPTHLRFDRDDEMLHELFEVLLGVRLSLSKHKEDAVAFWTRATTEDRFALGEVLQIAEFRDLQLHHVSLVHGFLPLAKCLVFPEPSDSLLFSRNIATTM